VGLTLLVIIPHMLWLKLWRSKTPMPVHAQRVKKITAWWARTIIKASGAKIHIKGLQHVPADRAVLFMANHQSDFDIVLFLAHAPIPIGFVAKIEMLKAPLLRTWIKLLNSVFLDRKDIRQGAKAILEGIEILKSGHSLVLFPEGTRSKSDAMGPFRAGSFKLATKPQIPIIPVTIDGSYKIMEGNNYIVTPADVYMTFHPVVETQGLSQEELAALPARVEAIIKNGKGAAHEQAV
jgi:1-acyl-sn-glycerol-3-phosphate acyltransferase